MPCYEHFVALQKSAFVPLVVFLLSHLGTRTGLYYIDSTALAIIIVYPAHLRTRKSSGDMMRKLSDTLSDTLSHNMCHLLGTSFRKKPSTASQKPL